MLRSRLGLNDGWGSWLRARGVYLAPSQFEAAFQLLLACRTFGDMLVEFDCFKRTQLAVDIGVTRLAADAFALGHDAYLGRTVVNILRALARRDMTVPIGTCAPTIPWPP